MSVSLPSITLQPVLDPQRPGKCHRKEGNKLARYSCGGQSIVCGLGEYEGKEKKFMLGKRGDTLAPCWDGRSMINTVWMGECTCKLWLRHFQTYELTET